MRTKTELNGFNYQKSKKALLGGRLTQNYDLIIN